MTWKRWKAGAAALGLAFAGLVIGACGSGEEATTTTPPPPPVSASTADQLATLSNRIATNLEAGLTCDAAYAADELKTAVEDADLSASLRPGVEEVATRLVNEVNCPPPPPPPEEDKKKKDEEKGEEGGIEGPGGGNGDNVGPPGHGGVSPGQAKLKGEE